MQHAKLRLLGDMYNAEWYEDGGKRRRASLGTKDLSEAKAALQRFKSDYEAQRRGVPRSVEEIYHAYAPQNAAKTSHASVLNSWKQLKKVFGGNLQPAALGEGLVEHYIESRQNAGARPSTIATEMSWLRAALNMAERKNWIAKAPFIRVPAWSPPREFFLTKPQARSVLDSCTLPHVMIFMVTALTTAGRVSAILEAKWDQVDFERRKIRLNPEGRTQTTKGRSVAPMNDMAFEVLIRAKEGATSDYVVEWGGQRIKRIKRAVATAGRRAGLEETLTPHVLRHTAAVWMAEARVPMEEIAQYLGHENPKTTYSVYARFSPEHLQEAARALVF